MKKVFLFSFCLVAAFSLSAAATNWKYRATDITGVDNEGTYTGSVDLYASINGADEWKKVSSGPAEEGSISYTKTQFSTEALVAGKSYDFYFTMMSNNTEGDVVIFKSTVLADYGAQESSTVALNFGSQAGQTWSVPEPFSGTLVLVGMAGLALRRKLKKQKKA